jgi:hypothetical protein
VFVQAGGATASNLEPTEMAIFAGSRVAARQPKDHNAGTRFRHPSAQWILENDSK